MPYAKAVGLLKNLIAIQLAPLGRKCYICRPTCRSAVSLIINLCYRLPVPQPISACKERSKSTINNTFKTNFSKIFAKYGKTGAKY